MRIMIEIRILAVCFIFLSKQRHTIDAIDKTAAIGTVYCQLYVSEDATLVNISPPDQRDINVEFAKRVKNEKHKINTKNK